MLDVVGCLAYHIEAFLLMEENNFSGQLFGFLCECFELFLFAVCFEVDERPYFASDELRFHDF